MSVPLVRLILASPAQHFIADATCLLRKKGLFIKGIAQPFSFDTSDDRSPTESVIPYHPDCQ